jgi:hypothetical protein
MSDKRDFFVFVSKLKENWKQMEQNIQVMYAWRFPITILFRFCSFFPLLFFASSEAFNGTLTDINRSRDEWRLTLKYYADSLVVDGLFFCFFPSLAESLKRSSAAAAT